MKIVKKKRLLAQELISKIFTETKIRIKSTRIIATQSNENDRYRTDAPAQGFGHIAFVT